MKKYSRIHLENFTLEELEAFSQEQLDKVSIEGLKSYLRMLESEKKEDRRIQLFLEEEYPKLSNDEKASYWAGGLFRSMRSNEESNQNPYSFYTEEWLCETLKQEPSFMELLPKIYNIWGGMFDAGKVDRIIQRHYKNINKNR